MKITFIQPRPELQPYIESFWVFESPVGLPQTDSSIAAPNGCSKLVIPYQNSLFSSADDRVQVSREQGLYFVGNRDSSTLIRSTPQTTGFIVIEFTPHGAYPIFGIPMQEMANGLFDAETVFGRWGRDTRESLRNLVTVGQKVDCVQNELLSLLQKNFDGKGIVDFCVRSLKVRDGRIAIKQLEKQTGYSRRYLDSLFATHVGLPPKALARIFRFQKFYHKWANGLPYEVLKQEFEDYYYDQAHFTKEFTKMTGYSPRRFVRDIPNEFGRRITLK